MAKVNEVSTINLVLNEQEAQLVAAVFQHVRLGREGWNSVAADIAIALEPYFCEFCGPNVEFSFEDRNGNEIEMGGIYTTIEVSEGEAE